MKVISINIPPKDKSHWSLQSSHVTDSNRADSILGLVHEENPDLIFFVEQYGPVYTLVEETLRLKYRFIAPVGFEPSTRSYAGVTCAVKIGIDVEKQIDGEELKVKQTAKFLGLRISGEWYLGVHYPQPSSAVDFDKEIKKFVVTNRVRLIIGDFNPLRGTVQMIAGYTDAIGNRGATSLFKTKLDYVFVPNSTIGNSNNIIFDASVMDRNSESFFSDHVVSGVIFR